jgi:YD repeat-containing protein
VYSYSLPSGSYDGVGNVVSYSDSVMGTWGFGYDPLNRLTGAAAGNDAPAGLASDYGCWSYDPFGNRDTESMSTTQCGNNPPLLSWADYNTNNSNQFTSTSQAPGGVSYDAAGDLTYDGVNTYLYEGEGRVCAIQSTPLPGVSSMTGYASP